MESIAHDRAECTRIVEEMAGRLLAGADGELVQVFAASVTELLAYATGAQDRDAVEAEKEAMAVGRRLVGGLLQRRLQAQINAFEDRSWGQNPCPTCGGATESQGRRGRAFTSGAGKLQLVRRYSYCAKCEKGWFPAHKAVGLCDSAFTPRVEEVVTMMATTVPHGMAVQLVEELLSVAVSEHGVQQMVERRAQGVAALLDEEAVRAAPFDAQGHPLETVRPADATDEIAEVAYLEMDGVVPMTREELRGPELSEADRRKQRRARKAGARGGRGRRYRLVGREVKNAVLYRGAHCAKESASRGFIVDKHYVSHLGDWKRFAELLWPELLRQRFDQARRLVVISDGADWIRSLCEWLPVPVLLILDLFHVKHRIWEVAHALHGEHTPAARRWAEAQCARVEAGGARDVIQSLRFLKPASDKARDLVSSLSEYLKSNLDRVDYPRYRAMGLRVGSGAVESANYHVTGARLKLQGMRWSEQGAREMAYLRADLFNNNWTSRTRQLLVA